MNMNKSIAFIDDDMDKDDDDPGAEEKQICGGEGGGEGAGRGHLEAGTFSLPHHHHHDHHD